MLSFHSNRKLNIGQLLYVVILFTLNLQIVYINFNNLLKIMIRRKPTTTEKAPEVISDVTNETPNQEVSKSEEKKLAPRTRTRVAKVTPTEAASNEVKADDIKIEEPTTNDVIKEEVSAVISDINQETEEIMKDSDKEKAKKAKSKAQEKDKKEKEKKKAKAKKDKQKEKDKEKKRKAKKKEKAKKAKAKDKAKAKKKEQAKKKSKAKAKSKKKK